MATPLRPTDTEGGILESNHIQAEMHTVTSVNSKPYRILIPIYAPFYVRDFELTHISSTGERTPLTEHTDYNFVLRYMDPDRKTGFPVYGGVEVLNEHLTGHFEISYRMLGDEWVPDRDYIYTQMLETIFNPRVVWWDQLTNVQQLFPPTDHPTHADEISGHKDLLAKLEQLAQAVLQAAGQYPASVLGHVVERGNPHGLVASDIDLGKVKNYPVATDSEVVTGNFETDEAGNEIEKYITHRQARLLFQKLLLESQA